MEISVPFSDFYAKELQAAFERSGRPDETFFARCAAVSGINAKYYARIGDNDANTLARIEGARDIEECAFSHPKIKSHYVRYYSYTASNLHFMEVYARSHERLREHPELIAQAEELVAGVIRSVTEEVDALLVKAQRVMADNGAMQSVRYGTGPLLVPAEIVSPHCDTYLTVLMKADVLFSLLEYQRLRGLATSLECDAEFARVDRLLKSIQRAALRLATGLRRRLNTPDAGGSSRPEVMVVAADQSCPSAPDEVSLSVASHADS